MAKFHVHVYQLSGLIELDLQADSEQEAMSLALAQAKELEKTPEGRAQIKEIASETPPFLAIPFEEEA